MDAQDTTAARRLLSAAAVRDRAGQLFEHALGGDLEHFAVDLSRLEEAADEVVATIRQNYPNLDIPLHARWRHFSAGGVDRWGEVAGAVEWQDAAALARAGFDLAIVSVLLDAGAGPGWAYEEGRTGGAFTRSEGLALASFDMLIGGAFSSRPEEPLRADAEALAGFSVTELARGFQVRPGNPLVGLEGRAALLNRLGRVVAAAPDVFGHADEPRPGGLLDLIVETTAAGRRIPAVGILEAVLVHLGPIWPGRIALGGVDLGDTWRHPLATAPDATDGLVPFHKLSQWLSYSLVEPLEWAGYEVVDLDGLTGLPEYRNGGLFLDTGVVALRRAEDGQRAHEVGSTLVVEWRALTVALLDRIAPLVRDQLGLSASDFPLAKVLEGGTWAAGRRLAQRRRDGAPPIAVISDGTVF